ncbi:hypothetical protein DLM77_17500 [Leptospira yasudae]|uniref:Uncharacterized protein n=1 Tax=Leptospira yasudae TaxID=2202201 RepID=A0ABX9LZ56_9LEPT|nr:hypothetical protein DLM77_17500 [Leptospira yasudae]
MTKAFIEIPLSAAFIFAFLNNVSGISKVVFTLLRFHKYGSLQVFFPYFFRFLYFFNSRFKQNADKRRRNNTDQKETENAEGRKELKLEVKAD